MRIVQTNFGLWCQRKDTQFRLENENSEAQMWDKHGHVVISAVCVKVILISLIYVIHRPGGPYWEKLCPLS